MPAPFTLSAEAFAPGAISSETSDMNATILAAEFEAPARRDIDLGYERTLSPGAGILPKARISERATTRVIGGPSGKLEVRIIPPSSGTPQGLYIHFHGGGFCLGRASGQDAMLEGIADASNVVAISVDYRLAPEHPFPAGAADAEAALWWAVRNGLPEFGCDRIVTGGESAGANLALVGALRLRNRRSYTGLCGINLSQGGYDLRMSPSMRLMGKAPVVSRDVLAHHVERYVGDGGTDNPEVSPLLADLQALPPALFTVGTCDPTIDDTMFLYCRWLAAGNQARLDIYPGGVHGFNFLPIAIGREASRRIEAFIGERCAAD